MGELINGIPLPEDEDERQQRLKALEPFLLHATEDYPEPYYMLEYKGVPFSTLGGIQALSGQKKNGKTFVLAQLMAVILNGGESKGRVATMLHGLRVPERTLDYLGHLPKVLYVDTEMERLNSAKVLRRVLWLCGEPTNRDHERFHVLWLRSITKDDKEPAHVKRYRLIKEAIDVFQPDAVFIDGLRDILGNFNDLEESAGLIGELMALAEQRGICIWNTLHQNPRARNDDESKMRGHAGTELGNKVTDTLVSIKHKENGEVWFTVKQDDARGKDLDDWEFVVTDDAGALGVPKMRNAPAYVDRESEQEKQDVIEADKYFKMYPWTSSGARYSDLERFFKQKGLTSARKICKMFDLAFENKIIWKKGRNYFYAGLNGDIPNDEEENIDFTPRNDVPY